MDILAIIDSFNAAWNRHDLDAALALCTEDIVFEGTSPAPQGSRYEGRAAVAESWRPIFQQHQALFDFEEIIPCGPDRVVQRWRYDWADGFIRGIDLITLRGGLIAQKLSYVKG